MPEPEEEGTPLESEQSAPAATPPPSITLAPDHVRNSPEYQELLRQNRALARQKGDAETAAATARAQAEAARQAAEAAATARVQQQIRDTLGEEGVTFWSEFADLSSTDPVAAAQRLAEFRRGTQSPPAGSPAAGQPQPAGGQQMPAQGTGAPPPASSELHADSPLGTIGPQSSDDEVIAAFDKRITEITERNRDPMTRNRVTDKERAEGFMALFAKGVIEAKRKAQGAR